jgi:hypothetical protein
MFKLPIIFAIVVINCHIGAINLKPSFNSRARQFFDGCDMIETVAGLRRGVAVSPRGRTNGPSSRENAGQNPALGNCQKAQRLPIKRGVPPSSS